MALDSDPVGPDRPQFRHMVSTQTIRRDNRGLGQRLGRVATAAAEGLQPLDKVARTAGANAAHALRCNVVRFAKRHFARYLAPPNTHTAETPTQARPDRLSWASVRRLLHPAARLSRWLDSVGLLLRPLLGLKSLAWRIFVANLLGLGVMIGGVLYLSQHQTWLIDTKTESLQAQGEIIAQAIADSGATDGLGSRFPDPDNLLEPDATRGGSLRTYDLDTLEFPIRPDKVAPFLYRLTEQSGTRVRVYSRDGTLILDSRGPTKITRGEPPSAGHDKAPSIQDFWSRAYAVFTPSSLPVYKEIGSANGTAYAEVRMALQGTSTPMLMVNDKGQHIVSVAIPVERMKGIIGAVLVSTRDGEIDGVMRVERHIISWVAALAVLATALSSMLLARTIAGPMRRLSEGALKVKRNISAREALPEFPDRKDEIGQMAASFRDMTAALYRRIELSEKFAADVAHELKNPVTAVRSATESLTYVTNEADRNELVANIQNDLKRLDKLITDISNFSRLDAELSLHETAPVDMARLVKGVAQTLNDINGAKQGRKPVTVEFENGAAALPASFVVQGHDGRLSQVLTNLIDNAISFSPERGKVSVRLSQSAGEIEVSIEDEGPGIPPCRFEKIFERFYTDRPDSEAISGKNSGLGLSISQEIVEAHGGRIWAENRKPGAGASPGASLGADPDAIPSVVVTGVPVGARFVVRLPVNDQGRQRTSPKAAIKIQGRPKPQALLKSEELALSDRTM